MAPECHCDGLRSVPSAEVHLPGEPLLVLAHPRWLLGKALRCRHVGARGLEIDGPGGATLQPLGALRETLVRKIAMDPF